MKPSARAVQFDLVNLILKTQPKGGIQTLTYLLNVGQKDNKFPKS